MSRRSNDPYGDFVVRVMNSARIARAQADSMSHDEADIVEVIRSVLLELDPSAKDVIRANVSIVNRKENR